MRWWIRAGSSTWLERWGRKPRRCGFEPRLAPFGPRTERRGVTEEQTYSAAFRKKVYDLHLSTCCSLGCCRFALVINDGDMERAKEYLREDTKPTYGVMDGDRNGRTRYG